MSLPSTLPYHLMEQIGALIIDGTFKPGERLGEIELEERFASSRSPIREALRLLEVKGLAVHVPRRGFRVRLMSEKEVGDLYHLRAELEAYTITQLPGGEALAALVGRLEAINAAMAEAHGREHAHDYLEQNTRFHSELLQATGNKPLMNTLDQINQVAQPLRYNVLKKGFGSSSALDYHRAIVAALSGARIEQARTLMREHVLVSLPAVLKHYDALVSEAAEQGRAS